MTGKVEPFTSVQFGWRIILPYSLGWDDRYVVTGLNYRHKLLHRRAVDDDNGLYEVRQLSNTERPTVVMKLKVKPNIELPAH